MIIDILLALVQGLGWTVAITFGALLIGLVLGIPLVLVRRARNAMVRWIAAVVIELVRSIPPIVWLFLLYYAVAIGAFRFNTFAAAVIGLGIISGAYIAEIYRAALDAVPAGQWEAAHALGLHATRMYVRIMLPQAVLFMIPTLATYAISLLKDSAVASIIGATDITFFAFQLSRQSGGGLLVFLMSAAIYLVLSIPIAAIARLGGGWLEGWLTA